MNINNINQMFNEKVQDINSRLPKNINVNNKFQALLEDLQLKNTTATETSAVAPTESNSTSATDVTSLLQNMMSTQSLLNSTLGVTGNSMSSGLFPTSSFNNTINTIQQTQLLNALKTTTPTEE